MPPVCTKVPKDWDNLFLKDNFLYLKNSLSGTDINNHLIAVAGLHDEAGHQGRDSHYGIGKD